LGTTARPPATDPGAPPVLPGGLAGKLTVHSTLGPVQIAGGVGQVASAVLPR